MQILESDSFRDSVFRPIAQSAKLIVVLAILGGLLGYAASMLVQPKWMAKMTIQIGQLSTPVTGGLASRLVENQFTASDRYNLPSSRLKVLRALGLAEPESGDGASNLIFGTLRATTTKSPDLLEVQVTGYSREQAVAALSAAFKALSDDHSKLFDPTVTQLKSDLSWAAERLAAAEKAYASTYDLLKSGIGQQGAAQTSQARDVLVTNLATITNTQIIDLRQQTAQLREALEPNRTYPTRIVGDIYVPKNPSTPGKVKLGAAGLLFGMIAGMVFAVLRVSPRV